MKPGERGDGVRRRAGSVLTAALFIAACGGSTPGDAIDRAASETSARSTEAGVTTVPASSAGSGKPTTTAVTTTGVPPADPDAAPSPDDPPPADAEALSLALIRAETAIRDPSIDDSTVAAWGRYQQRLYLQLARNPDWVERALAIDDPVIRRAAEANWTARVNLDALVASEQAHTEVPAWRVVAPRPVEELLGYYRDGEATWGIDWSYLAAINLVETRMGRIEGLSSAGAVGPMQFLPTTWAECCDGDATDPADAIPGAARYLTIRGGPENMERAIWGYNNSDRYVAAVTAYASVLQEDELAYRGYHAWEIFFRSTEGLLLLPVGYEEPEPLAAATWLEANPELLID